MLTPHTQSVPRGACDAWSGSEWENGVQIDRMGELTTVAVRTARSLYEITILNGHTGDVLVRGGGFSRNARQCNSPAAPSAARF